MKKASISKEITNFSQLWDLVNETQKDLLSEEDGFLKEVLDPDGLITLLFDLNTLEPKNENYFKLHQFVIGNPKSKDVVKKSIKYLTAVDFSKYDLLNLPYENAIEIIKTELRTYINFEKNKKLIYQSFFEKNIDYFDFQEFFLSNYDYLKSSRELSNERKIQ